MLPQKVRRQSPARRSIPPVALVELNAMSEMEQKSLSPGYVTHRLSILRVNQCIAKLEPAAQLFRGTLDWPGPTHPCKGAFHVRKVSVLPQR